MVIYFLAFIGTYVTIFLKNVIANRHANTAQTSYWLAVFDVLLIGLVARSQLDIAFAVCAGAALGMVSSVFVPNYFFINSSEMEESIIMKNTVEPTETTRVVVCAANRYGSTLVLGARHFDKLMIAQITNLQIAKAGASLDDGQQGFIDQYGVFMTRSEALVVAQAAGQIGRYRPKHSGDWLCSEDLY